jgi:RNA polymerase sigma factor (sigma-70 family)
VQRDSERIYDEYLVASAQAGDRAAWERLVARWHPRLLRHAWRLTGHADRAADRVQDAWVDIWKGLRRLDDVVAFPAWAFRIVTRRCQRGWHAAERAHADLLDIADTPHDSDDAAAADAMARDIDLARVQAAMATLPPTQRAALSLFHLEDLSVAEISIALDVPPGTVKTRLMHARRKLRARLEGDSDEQDR